MSRSCSNLRHYLDYAFTDYIKARITALSTWNLAEVQIGIVAACWLTLRQPLARLMPSTEVVTSLLSKLGLAENIKSKQIPSFVRAPWQISTQTLQYNSRVALRVTQTNQSEYSHSEYDTVPSTTAQTGGRVTLDGMTVQ